MLMIDCPADEDLCAVVSYKRTESASWHAIPGEGTLTISTMTETRVAGSVDAKLSGETPSLHLTGEFGATLD